MKYLHSYRLRGKCRSDRSGIYCYKNHILCCKTGIHSHLYRLHTGSDILLYSLAYTPIYITIYLYRFRSSGTFLLDTSLCIDYDFVISSFTYSHSRLLMGTGNIRSDTLCTDHWSCTMLSYTSGMCPYLHSLSSPLCILNNDGY